MRNQPVQLTEEQLKKNTAQHLLTLLEEVSSDGILTDVEILQLDAWLSRTDDASIPAIAFLSTLIKDALEDRVITDVARQAIVFAILRVMPDEIGNAARLRYGAMFGGSDRPIVDPHMTAGQEKMMKTLGIPVPPECTRAEAIDMITAVVNESQALSSLHMIVLRFWGREDLVNYREAVSACEWLNNWYAEDPARYAAWRLWRKEHPECCSPDSVAIGEGTKYLEKVKA
jgi:hypothetical protein